MSANKHPVNGRSFRQGTSKWKTTSLGSQLKQHDFTLTAVLCDRGTFWLKTGTSQMDADRCVLQIRTFKRSLTGRDFPQDNTKAERQHLKVVYLLLGELFPEVTLNLIKI